MNPVNKPNSLILAEFTELIAATNLYVGAIMHLFKAPVAFNPTMALTDLSSVEADFTGYAASSTIVWAAPFINPAGVPTLSGGLKQFVGGSPLTVANTIYGWYLTNAAATALLFWRSFDAPVNVAVPLQGLDVIPAIPAYLGN